MVDPNVQMTEPAAADPRSIPQLIADLASDLGALVRGEVQLVRAEIAEKGGRLGRAALEAGLGAVLLFAGLIFVLQAASVALYGWLGPIWANVLLGVVLAALGAVALRMGMATAKPENLALDRSARQIKETMRAASEQTK